MKKLLSEKVLLNNILPYTLNQIVLEKMTTGTQSISIEKGTFEVTICGAGGGGGGSATSHSWLGSNGGSGAAFKGMVKFPKTTLTITVGNGGSAGAASGRNAGAGSNGTASSITQGSTALITTGGGNGGYGTGNGSGANNGKGGILTVGSIEIISEIIRKDGVQYSTVSILGNGYGGGGAARASNSGTKGQNGYLKIIYKGK